MSTELANTRRSLRAQPPTCPSGSFPLVIAAVVLALLGSAYAALRAARSVSRATARAVGRGAAARERRATTPAPTRPPAPIEVRTVSAAVNLLAGERARAVAQDHLDDVLRTDVRELTSAVRIGQDAQTIARTLVAGLGRVFDVDLVWLVTFEDTRVPHIAERWRRDSDGRRARRRPRRT